MARDTRPQLLPSLLLRLTDDDPDVSTEPDWARSQGVTALRQSVRNDLEALLNTRLSVSADPDDESELIRSLLYYGVPDTSSISMQNDEQKELLRRAVESAVQRFEPRLGEVRVVVDQTTDESERRLKLSIEAQLLMNPHPEAVRFDTFVRTTTGKWEINSES